jgi:hypothetical protein
MTIVAGFLKIRMQPLCTAASVASMFLTPSAAYAQLESWRQPFQVGQEVQFSVSERAADMQTCIVTENEPDQMMRVRCKAFKQWAARVYIVYGKGNLGGGPTAAKTSLNAPQAAQPKAAARTPEANNAQPGGSLKVGEYACYGSGGRAMIGLSFRVQAGGSYTDLDGGNAGTVSAVGGAVRFTGGHMGGQSGRMVGKNSFAIGTKAQCEPY